MNIVADPNCPSYAPLPPWKMRLSRWFGVEWKREIICFKVGNMIICSAENYAKFEKAHYWLSLQLGGQYE